MAKDSANYAVNWCNLSPTIAFYATFFRFTRVIIL